MGDRLLCFQIGNEDDQLRGMPQFRDASYDFNNHFKDHREFVDAVRSSVPEVKFAGPDVATNMDWLFRFAERKDDDAIFLSSHFYAMGPAQDPRINAVVLLGSNERLQHQIEQVHKAVAVSNLPYWMTEGNSCFGGWEAWCQRRVCIRVVGSGLHAALCLHGILRGESAWRRRRLLYPDCSGSRPLNGVAAAVLWHAVCGSVHWRGAS